MYKRTNITFMKDFVKITLATLAGLFIFTIASTFLSLAIVGAIAASSEKQVTLPHEGVLKIDMSSFVLSEQTKEDDILSTIQAQGKTIKTVGIYNAVKAVNTAATDPAVKFIYLKPDGAMGGTAQIEEFRTALNNFRSKGKAIVSYMENPTNAGYYLASVSDKIYMTSYDGGINMFNGVSSQMIFLKDILDRLGVNVQLIRHGKYKSAGEMFIRNSASKENMQQTKELVESIWESWAVEIAQSRNITVDDLNSILDNLELCLPEDWVRTGLVDEVVNLNQLEQKLCDVYVAEKFDDIKSISLVDYAKAKNTINYKATNKIAVIYAEGNIVDGDDNSQVAGDRFAKLIAKVRQDSSVKAVVLRVNSPGGSVLAAEKIKTEVDLLRQSRPVIASYGDYAASGGYWISANCDKIYSNATTLTGSIGVFSMIPDLSGTVKNKLHVNVTAVNSNDHGDMYTSMRALSKSEVDYMQKSVENIYAKFTALVAAGRGMTVPEVDEVAQGRVWSGAEALKIGLVDEIGTLEDAIAYAAISIDGVSSISDVQIVEYPKPQTTLDMLLETLGSDKNAFAGTPLENVAEAFMNWNANESGNIYARLPYEIEIR